MKKSKHADARFRQRGILDKRAELILEHGSPTYRPGGVLAFQISKKKRQSLISYHKREIQLLDKVVGTVILQGDDDTIITAYHIN